MIIGIGHDVTEIARIDMIIQGTAGNRFIERVLSLREREYIEQRFVGDGMSEGGMSDEERQYRRRLEFVSGRFAAKEAVAKALGCGIGGQLGFQDIEIIPDGLGKPICTLSTESFDRLQLATEAIIHVSITHTDQIASAFAVVELR